MRQAFFAAVTIALGGLLAWVVLEVALRLLPVSDSLYAVAVNDTNPVMRFRSNRDILWSRGPTFDIVTRKRVNNFGFVNAQDYDPSLRTPLLAVIGDSYVEAGHVADDASLQARLAAEVGAAGRVYSFASSGSPLSNYLAYARYAAQTFGADALVFVIIDNDFDQSLPAYRNSPGMHYFVENSNGDLELVRRDYSPAMRTDLLRKSALARYLLINVQLNRHTLQRLVGRDAQTTPPRTPDAQRIRDAKRVVVRFFELLPEVTGIASDKILFVMDGMRPALYDAPALASAPDTYPGILRQHFREHADAGGYELIDMQPVFVEAHRTDGTRFEFPTDGHWNAAGHALAAHEIAASRLVKTLFTLEETETAHE